jgi:mannose-6-phosphate isomerase
MMYKFRPLLKQTLWGGSRIIAFKHLEQQIENVGESWEISGVRNNETIVSGGPHDGTPLNQLVRQQKERLVGKENYQRFGNEFPLLIKFIDAHQDLSIQVHPNDEVARRHGKERGKTEMWYCLAGDQPTPSDALAADRRTTPMLYNGLKKQLTPEEYKAMVANDTITDALARYEVHEGDVFFIPAGRIHAIGAGCFVAEIQQTSDVTYSIYDYKRRDKNGNYRELHTDLAAESIDYTVLNDYRTHYRPLQDEGVQLVSCPYFTTAVYDLDDPMTIDYSELDSFVILIGLQGAAEVADDSGQRLTFREGETLLIPATTQNIRIEGTIKFLETYV